MGSYLKAGPDLICEQRREYYRKISRAQKITAICLIGGAFGIIFIGAIALFCR